MSRRRVLPWLGGVADDSEAGPVVQLFPELELGNIRRRHSGIAVSPPYQQYKLLPAIIMCPSDDVEGANYRFCTGTSITYERYLEIPGGADGVIVGEKLPTRASDIVDGFSNTALLSERLVGSGYSDTKRSIAIGPFYPYICADTADFDCASRYLKSSWPTIQKFHNAGKDWTSTGWGVAAYSHLLPPNSDFAGFFNQGDSGLQFGIVPPTSNHPGLVTVAMMDGSVRTVTDTIDMSIWKAMATRGSGD